jgi:hypothetical protein
MAVVVHLRLLHYLLQGRTVAGRYISPCSEIRQILQSRRDVVIKLPMDVVQMANRSLRSLFWLSRENIIPNTKAPTIITGYSCC